MHDSSTFSLLNMHVSFFFFFFFVVIQLIDTFSTFSLLNMAYREVHVGLNPRAMEIDSGEKRLNELGYKQELRREMVYDFFFFAK